MPTPLDDVEHVRTRRVRRGHLARRQAKSKTLSAAQLTLLASLLSLASAVAGGMITGWFTTRTEEVKGDSSINLEKIKFETGLIIKAISTDDQFKAIRTLKFFADAGLIPTFERRVASLAENDNGAAIPALESSSPSPRQLPPNEENVRISQFVGYLSQTGSAQCNVTFVDRKHFIVPTHCVDTPYNVAQLEVTAGQLSPQLNGIRPIAAAKSNMSDPTSLHVVRLSAISDHVTLGTMAADNPVLTKSPQLRSPERSETVKVVYVDLQGYYQFSYMILQENCSVLEVNSPMATDSLKGDFAYRCTTPQGTSGSPIIARDGSIIGLVEATTGTVDLGAPIPIESIKVAISREPPL